MIYNTTFHIDKSVTNEGLEYFKSVFIPDAVRSGVLSCPLLRRVIQEGEEDGISVSVQFEVKDIETLIEWEHAEGQLLQQRLVSTFGHKIAGFTTLLENISLSDEK